MSHSLSGGISSLSRSTMQAAVTAGYENLKDKVSKRYDEATADMAGMTVVQVCVFEWFVCCLL